MRVVGPDGAERLHACASLAETAPERRRGLKDRESLGPNEGLLIVFPTEGEVCIENGGVAFAIDVVYLDASGEVVAVERDVPAGDDTARCHDPVQRVLELPAGAAGAVAEGDLLR